MTERRYLPTFADLIDRLSIVTLKMIFIPENREAYKVERALIEHDIDLLLQPSSAGDHPILLAEDIRAIMVVMLANRFIWENESKARLGGAEQDKLLKATHSINGIRARAKNILASRLGERVDLKTDCLAADLPAEFGNWDIF